MSEASKLDMFEMGVNAGRDLAWADAVAWILATGVVAFLAGFLLAWGTM
ncbi:hypothetical protein ACFOGJ_16130 [Marinibaculum pumilum]|uniref:Uncharacterized protein n=1 Tax=Marinibaculum pumilum TaxID=1766165 RepID=A0ABV7L278_9PROT